MDRATRILAEALGGVALVVGVWLAAPLYLPESTGGGDPDGGIVEFLEIALRALGALAIYVVLCILFERWVPHRDGE